MNIAKHLTGKVTFIIGSGKNAGKTAFLNLALAELRQQTEVAYLSVGVDGEKTDAVFGNKKPRIFAQKKDILVTTEGAANSSDALFEILNVYQSKTALGRLVLLRVIREGTVELIGPENNTRLAEILADLEKHKARTVLIDGAVDRITQAAAHKNPKLVYVARIGPENLSSAIDTLKLLHSAAKTRRYGHCEQLFASEGPSIIRQGNQVVLRGAVTASKLASLLKTDTELIFEDLTKLFISYAQWQALEKKHTIYFAANPDLTLIIVNLYNITRNEFLQKLAHPELEERIVFNPYYK